MLPPLSLLVLAACAVAHAAPFGRVTELWEDQGGEFTQVSSTAEAERIRRGKETEISQGLEVQLGDTVRTDDAHVAVRLSGGGQVHVPPNGEYIPEGPGRITLVAGRIYAWVRRPFEVDYQDVSLATDGTVFMARATEDGSFHAVVQQGRLKVSAGGQTVTVEKGGSVKVAAGGAPVVAAVAGAAQLARAASLKRRVAPSTLSGGLLVGFGTTGLGGDAGPRGFADLRLVGSFEPVPWMVTDLTVGVGRGAAGRVPIDAGAAYKLGRFALGGQLSTMVTRIERCGQSSNRPYQAKAYWGGHAYGRLRLPLTPWVDLETRLEAGYLDGLSIDGAAGLLVGF